MTVRVPRLNCLTGPPLPSCAPPGHHPTLLPPAPCASDPGSLDFQLRLDLLLFTGVNNTPGERKEDLKLCFRGKSGRCSTEMNYHICSFFFLPQNTYFLSQVQHITILTNSLPQLSTPCTFSASNFMSGSLELCSLLSALTTDRQTHYLGDGL